MNWLTWKYLILTAHAANTGFQTGSNSITLINPLACGSSSDPGLVCIANAIWTALFTISIPIVSVMVIVGAFQILTAAGNPEKVTKGRNTIIYAAVGFAIILLAGAVVTIIQNILGVKS
jgi:Type IV secretion system pilin